MITSSYSNGWSRSGPAGWPPAGFGGKAQPSEFTDVGKPAGAQVAGALLGGSMEKLLSAHLNARVGTNPPVMRVDPVDRVVLSPQASVQVATTATPANGPAAIASAEPKSPAGGPTAGSSADEYRALGRLAQASRGGRSSASAMQRGQDAPGVAPNQPIASQSTTAQPPAGQPAASQPAVTQPAPASAGSQAPAPSAPPPASAPPGELAAPSSSGAGGQPPPATEAAASPAADNPPPASGASTTAVGTQIAGSGSSGGLFGVLFGRKR